MIQQICLSQNKDHFKIDFNQPLELVINAKDFSKFEKVIALLFDRESVKRIRKVKTKALSS